MAGIKESKEALVGVNELNLDLISRLKDGFDKDDIDGFMDRLKNDQAFRAKLVAAYEGGEKIPDEAMDLDLFETAELTALQVQYVPKYLKAFSKK